MNRLSFLKAKRNKWYSGIFMIAFFFILLCFPVAIHSVFNLQQDVESNISHYARGSYDLLVRAEGNQHPLEEELGIVPENYIGFGQVVFRLSNGNKFEIEKISKLPHLSHL